MSILITAATTAKAYQLKNKLQGREIILGDYAELPAFMLNKGMIRLPNPASVSYNHEMLTLCLDREIDTVYAITLQEAANLAEAAQLFKEYNITIINGTIEL